MLTESDMETARDMIRSALGSDVSMNSRIFPSGSAAITIRVNRDTVLVDVRPPHEWAMSINPSDGDSFTGHEHVASSLSALLEIAKRELSAG